MASVTSAGKAPGQRSGSGTVRAAWCPLKTINREARLRSVSEASRKAAADDAAVTPGTTSKGTPASRRASISSAARPKIMGSPDFSRITANPLRADTIINSWMAACVIFFRPQRLPTLMTSACLPARFKMDWGTRSSCSTTPASASSRAALMVSKSGSPGPAPTR